MANAHPPRNSNRLHHNHLHTIQDGQQQNLPADNSSSQSNPAASTNQPESSSPQPPPAQSTSPSSQTGPTGSYIIVDTGQDYCYDEKGQITCPEAGQTFYGQDAQYSGLQPSYVDNGDGTVTDLNTGLMWVQSPGDKVTYTQAVNGAGSFNLAGYDDWRLPTIKELYSLMDFSGRVWQTEAQSTPFIDTAYFNFEYGDESAGERLIDAQYWSATEYVSTTMFGNETVFGVNFADGRIKGYPISSPRGDQIEFVRYVRGNISYGTSSYVDNGDGTISDLNTGLMWMQNDSGTTHDWDGALNYCESLSASGYDDWRLPNAKELHSIVDYTRAPTAANAAQQGAAIDPIFNITNEESYFWASTTHMDGPNYNGVYFAFGQVLGQMNGSDWIDVHGAGAQRSDPKSGDPSDVNTQAPQGDDWRINNYARCVRDGSPVDPFDGDVDTNTQTGGQDPTDQPSGGQGSDNPPNGPPSIDLAAAAEILGVTEEALRSALGPPPPDLAAAAEALGVTEQELMDALGISGGQGGPGGQNPGG